MDKSKDQFQYNIVSTRCENNHSMVFVLPEESYEFWISDYPNRCPICGAIFPAEYPHQERSTDFIIELVPYFDQYKGDIRWILTLRTSDQRWVRASGIEFNKMLSYIHEITTMHFENAVKYLIKNRVVNQRNPIKTLSLPNYKKSYIETHTKIAFEKIPYQISEKLQNKGFILQKQNGIDIIIPPMIPIPSGAFLMGSNTQQDLYTQENETPQHLVDAKHTYEMGKYPVTVAEYLCFINATAYPIPPDFGMGTLGILTWERQQEHPDNPVVCVSWRDATVYAQWLTENTGQWWKLPTEIEWEKAARGEDGRIYPWGNEWKEIDREVKNETDYFMEPIGRYPHHSSIYGCMDMCDNIQEWTNSLLAVYPYQIDMKNNTLINTGSYENLLHTGHVVRGSSWPGNEKYSRAAFRRSHLINEYSHHIGFRLSRAVFPKRI